MATATQKSGAGKQLDAGQQLDAGKQLSRRPARVRVPESMEFLIFYANGGEYHWTIVAGDGATLARPGGFASYDDADQAAHRVRNAASAAQFQRRATGTLPVDLIARRDATRDASDAERWLDEGGGFNAEAVANRHTPH